MIKQCSACGATNDINISVEKFVCEFCSSININPDFVPKKEEILDSTSNSFQLGKTYFDAGDYVKAEQYFEATIVEDANQVDPWVFLALIHAEKARPSKFQYHYNSARECINKVISIDPNRDILKEKLPLIANKFLSLAIIAAKESFDIGEKKFVAMGKSKASANFSDKDFQIGISYISSALEFNPNHVENICLAALYILNRIKFFKKIGLDTQFYKDNDKLYKDILREKFLENIEFCGKYIRESNLYDKSLEGLLEIPKIQEESNVQIDKSQSSRFGWKSWMIVILLLGYFLLPVLKSNSKNDNQHQSTSAANNINSSIPDKSVNKKVINSVNKTLPDTNALQPLQSESSTDSASIPNKLENENGEVHPEENNTQAKFNPSFDCKKAKLAVELMICNSDTLSELDYKISIAYKQARKVGSDKDKIKSDQFAWIKLSRMMCKDESCLEQVMRNRLAQLNQ